MRLADLEPALMRLTAPGEMSPAASLEEADGIMFLCPRCYRANGGPVGTHSILCWRPRVPQSEPPNPGRWEMQGTGLDDLTLVARSSSVHLKGPGCGAHFFVRAGRIEGE